MRDVACKWELCENIFQIGGIMEKWNKHTEKPTKNGTYKVKNNSGCNGSFGEVEYDVKRGWLIPEAIKPFYKILAWREK